MLNSLARWEIAGFLFVVVFGSLLHFVYRWSGNNLIVGMISPVNESTWEHLKLLFVPMLLFSAVEYFVVGKAAPDFIAAKSLGILFGMVAIVALFYTYTGIIGEHYLWADILTFVIGVAIAYLYSWKIISKSQAHRNLDWAGFLLVIVTIGFLVFTFSPPKIPLFLDPVSKGYGISKRKHIQ